MGISTDDICAWKAANSHVDPTTSVPDDRIAGAATGMLERIAKPTQIIWQSDSGTFAFLKKIKLIRLGETSVESEYRRSFVDMPHAKVILV